MKNAIWKYNDLEKLLGQEFPLVRRWAFEKIVDIYGRSRAGRIADLIDDSDEYISSGVIRYLSAYNHKKWAFRILRKFQDSTGDVAASCAIALGELGYTGAVQVFHERVESENTDYETLMGIVTALKLIRSDESANLLLLIGELYSSTTNGVFLGKICDALLTIGDREAVSLVTGLYMERAFSLDDKGNSILRSLIHHTDSTEFIDEFRSFVEERPFDILRYIKENVRHRITDILGEEFVRKTSEKFLKTSYLRLLGDIRRTSEMVLYSRKIITSDNEFDDPKETKRELLNYYLIDRIAGEARLLHVMNLSQVKKAIILCLCALLRIVFPRKAVKPLDINATKDVDLLLLEMTKTDEQDKLIERIVALANGPRKIKSMRDKVLRRLGRNDDTERTIGYLKLLSRLQPEKNLGAFWDLMDVKTHDTVCRIAEDGMVAAGNDAVEFIKQNFSSGDDSQKMLGLGILSRIPIMPSVRFVSENIDTMWDNYRDFVLYAVNELGSRKFIKPVLEKLTKNPMPDIEETYLLLCEINGVRDNRLESVRARVLEELRQIDSGINVKCDRSKALLRGHCNRKLICRYCHLGAQEA